MSRTSALVLSIALRFVGKFSGAVFFILVPFIAASLSESEDAVQLLIPVFLVGSAVSQFFVGSLADVYGKRRILFLLLGCFLLGSVLCGASRDLLVLRLGVFAVALGVGAIAGVGNTLIFDGYASVQKAARALSFSSILVIWAPALAMNAGVAIARFDWRWFFWLQAASALVMLWMTWRDVPDGPRSEESAGARFRKSAAGYGELLASPDYRMIANRMCLAGGGIVVFYTVGLPHLQGILGKSSAAIGWVPILIVMANSLGRLVSGFCMDRFSLNQLGLAGTVGCILGGASMIAVALFPASIWLTVPPMAVYVVGIGILFSPQRAEMMRVSAGKTATSESLLGILMALSGAGLAWGSMAFASLFSNVPLAIGILLLGLGIGAAIPPRSLFRLFSATLRKKSLPGVSQP